MDRAAIAWLSRSNSLAFSSLRLHLLPLTVLVWHRRLAVSELKHHYHYLKVLYFAVVLSLRLGLPVTEYSALRPSEDPRRVARIAKSNI